MVEYVLGLDGDDTLETTADEQSIFGLSGNDTLEHAEHSDVALVGGSGDDRYVFRSAGTVFVLENGNDLNDSIAEVDGPGSSSSFVYTLESRHLVFEHSNGSTLVIVDWELPENRIETWEVGGETFTYSEFRDSVLNGGNFLGDFTFEQVGYSSSEEQAFVDSIDNLYAQEAELSGGEIPFSITRVGTDSGDSLTGGTDGDTLLGHEGDDTLIGNAGNDRLDGGDGIDVMIGGVGNDIYFVDQADDVIVEAAGEGQDSVLASTSYDLSDLNVENIILTGTSDSDATGNNARNLIGGNAGNNVLYGRGGVDVLFGGGGSDVFVGGAEYDVYLFNVLFDDVEIQDGNSLSLININDRTADDLNYSVDGRNLLISDPLWGGSLLIRGYYEDPSQYIFVDSSNAYVNLPSPDDSLLHSRFVGLSSEVMGTLSSLDTSDFYQIRAESDGVITVAVSEMSEIIDVLVYDQDGVVIESGKTGTIRGIDLKFEVVGEQIYYIELRTENAASTNYNAAFSANYGPGTTLESAIEIGSDARIDLATIGGVNDPVDYYAYTAEADGKVSITLSMLSENVDLIIYDENGKELASSRLEENNPENLELDVSAGDQFTIGVVAAGPLQSTYSLLVDSTDRGEFGGDAGNTLALAAHVTPTFTLSQSVGFGSDNDDIFRLTAPSDGIINVTLDGFDQDLTLQVYDANGDLITSSRELLLGRETLNVVADEGKTYYIGVTPANGVEETEYTLQSNFISSGPEPGDTLGTALEIDASQGYFVTKTVGFDGDMDDLFVFTAAETGSVNISLSGFSSNLDLHVYNPSGARVASSRNPGTQSESLVLSVQEGEQYYIGATPVTALGSNYELDVAYSSSASSLSLNTMPVAPGVDGG